MYGHDGGLAGVLKWHGAHLRVFHGKTRRGVYPQMDADGRRWEGESEGVKKRWRIIADGFRVSAC